MTLNEYQQQAMSTCMESCDNDTYMLFGMMAEVGEIADKVAKWKRKREARMDSDRLVFSVGTVEEVAPMNQELARELGDVMWFCAGMAKQIGYTLEEIGRMNIDKLAARKAADTIVSHQDH